MNEAESLKHSAGGEREAGKAIASRRRGTTGAFICLLGRIAAIPDAVSGFPWRESTLGVNLCQGTISPFHSQGKMRHGHFSNSSISTHQGLGFREHEPRTATAGPFCWWLVVAVDHFSRRMMGIPVYCSLPSSAADRRYLKGTFRRAGERSAHIISDQGTQFTEKRFRRYPRRNSIPEFRSRPKCRT
jgi:Integrase core domain.